MTQTRDSSSWRTVCLTGSYEDGYPTPGICTEQFSSMSSAMNCSIPCRWLRSTSYCHSLVTYRHLIIRCIFVLFLSPTRGLIVDLSFVRCVSGMCWFRNGGGNRLRLRRYLREIKVRQKGFISRPRISSKKNIGCTDIMMKNSVLFQCPYPFVKVVGVNTR